MNEKEHNLQVRCVNWLRYQHDYLRPVFYSVPNGGLRNKAVAGKLKAEGQNKGVSDLMLDLPSMGFHGLKIEMKFGKNGQSEEQKVYQVAVASTGFKYVVCKDFETFKNVIEEWLACADKNMIQALKDIRRSVLIESDNKARERLMKMKKKHS